MTVVCTWEKCIQNKEPNMYYMFVISAVLLDDFAQLSKWLLQLSSSLELLNLTLALVHLVFEIQRSAKRPHQSHWKQTLITLWLSDNMLESEYGGSSPSASAMIITFEQETHPILEKTNWSFYPSVGQWTAGVKVGILSGCRYKKSQQIVGLRPPMCSHIFSRKL